MLERLVMLMLSFSACIICYLSGKLRISGKSGLTNRMSFDYGEGKTIINSLQTLFASMALSPNAVCDPSPIFSVLNLKTNEMGDCFQFRYGRFQRLFKSPWKGFSLLLFNQCIHWSSQGLSMLSPMPSCLLFRRHL